MERVYNFSAGPSMLPLQVLERAAAEMVNYHDTGMSVMEMSHRSPAYDAIIKKAEADFRKVMNIPDNYKVLFLQGGASTQFAAVPLNLMKTGKADYILSGQFSTKAYKEALKYGDAKGGRILERRELLVRAGDHPRVLQTRRGLRTYLLQQHDLRNEVPVHSGHRRHTARR